MSFPRYEEYRNPDVEWLDDVPAHWEVESLKRIASVSPSNVDKKSYDGEQPVRLCNYTDVYYNDVIVPDMEFMVATASPEQIAKFTLQQGDVLITKDSESADDIAVAAYVPQDMPGVLCGYHLAVVRPHGGLCGAFLKWLFDSAFIRSSVAVRANGLTRVGLSRYALDSLVVPLPPASEQRSIATFLDREILRIDALIAEQQRLIELLTEKRQAVISAVIEAGDSGESVRLGHLADLLPGFAFPSERFSFEEGGIRLLRGVNVAVGSSRWEETVYWIDDIDDRVKAYLLESGDVVLGMDRPWITEGTRVARVSDVDVPSLLVQRVLRLRPRRGVSSPFIELALASPAFRAFLEADMTGVSVPHISEKQVASFHVPALHTVEQTRRAGEASAALERLDSLVAACHRAIALLLERRVALISAAVTGKIDVRSLVDAEAVAA